MNEETLLNNVLTYIENQPEENNRDLLAFFQALPPHPNNVENPSLNGNDTINEGTRFGWESLAIFIGATVLGYILLRYGPDIYRGTKDFMLDLIQHSDHLIGTVTRDMVKQSALRALQNPDNHTRIAELLGRRVQG